MSLTVQPAGGRGWNEGPSGSVWYPCAQAPLVRSVFPLSFRNYPHSRTEGLPKAENRTRLKLLGGEETPPGAVGLRPGSAADPRAAAAVAADTPLTRS